MTRKDYETLAAALKLATQFDIYKRSADARSQFLLTANEIAVKLKHGNERFDRKKFLLACGIDAQTVEDL